MASANRTRYAVLGFLTRGPMSGYDIKKQVEASVSNFWSESFGQLYPTLRRMTEEGLIRRSEAPSAGGRARHVYAISERGREALSDWLREPTNPPPVRIEMLLKLFFGAECERESSRAQVLAYREQMEGDLARYAAIRADLIRDKADSPDLPFWLLTLRFGERDRAAHIAWCNEALAVLEELPDENAPPAQIRV